MVFKPGHPPTPGAGRPKGAINKPKPIEVTLAKLVKREIAKQFAKLGIAERLANDIPLIENQRNSKLQKQRAKRIERKQQFSENAKLLSPITQTPGFVRRVDRVPGLLVEKPRIPLIQPQVGKTPGLEA